MINELKSELTARGTDLIRTVDISKFSEKVNRGYKAAIILGTSLSKEFISGFAEGKIELPQEYWDKEHRV